MTASADEWEEWIWVCPKCGNRGKGTGEADAEKRCDTHLRMVHNIKVKEG